MLKLLLLVGLITAVYYVFFSKKKTLTAPKNDNSLEEAMIPCSTCGTYVQAKEAFMSSGKYYCSHECMNQNKDKQ
jgi:uncharacterized protein